MYKSYLLKIEKVFINNDFHTNNISLMTFTLDVLYHFNNLYTGLRTCHSDTHS